MKNKLMIAVVAAFALVTGVQAGTPKQDMIATRPALDAAIAEMEAANTAIKTQGFSAYGKMYLAIAHTQKVMDDEKAIVARGYAQDHNAFWRELAFNIDDTERSLQATLAEMQQKATAMIKGSVGEFGRIA